MSKRVDRIENFEFKDTEIGLIPKDWEVVRLGEVIVPNRVKIRKAEYNKEIPIVEKINFDAGEVLFRKKEKQTLIYFLLMKNI